MGPALDALDRVDASLAATADGFAGALADAVAILTSLRVEDVDASQVTTSIDEAIVAADATVVPETETATVTADITAAVDAADATIDVEADASAVTDEIERAVDAADTAISGDAFSGLAGGAEEAGSALSGKLAVGAQAAGSAIGAAAGETGGLVSGLGALGGPAGIAAVGVIGGLAAATSTFFNAALDARTATDLYNAALGELGPTVEHLDMGGLNTDLTTLAVQLGADDDAIRIVEARLTTMGVSAGRTREQAAGVAEAVATLALNFSAANPTLGTADQIIQRLPAALARGGRALNDFGVVITASEIETRAFRDTGKTTADQLTQIDRTAAGASIALERVGDVSANVAEGIDKPAIKLRALRQQLEETFETAGADLIDPLIGSLEELTPSLEKSAVALGEGLVAGVKLLTVTLKLASPLIEEFNASMELTATFLDGVSKVIDNPIDAITALGDAAAGDGGKLVDFFGDASAGAADLNTVGQHAFDSIISRAEDTPEAVEDVTGAIGDLTAGFEAAEDAASLFSDTLDATLGVYTSAERGLVRMEEATAKLKDSLAENGRTFDLSTEAGRKNRDAILDTIDATQRYEEGLVRLGQKTPFQAQQDFIDKLRTLRSTLPQVRGEFATYLDKLLETPPIIATDIVLNGADGAITRMDQLLARFKEFKKLRAEVGGAGLADNTALFNGPGGQFGGFFGVPHMVGEAGREIQVPTFRGQDFVVPNPHTEAILAGRASLPGAGPLVGELHINQVEGDIEATAFAAVALIGEMAAR